MPSPRPPFAKAVAVKSLELAIRFWPGESRHWGQALLAETHEIAHPIEAFFWALGGVTVFLRSHLSHLLALLKLPPGRTTSPLPVGANGPRFPRNPRLVTALIFLAIAGVLLLPAGREATSIVSSSWRDFEATPGETRVVERLAAKAEQDRDAHQLAFLANCEPDPDLSEKFANRAVELDPSLFWIYASRYRRPGETVNRQWLQRLTSSDPDNAFVYILAAQAAVNPIDWSKFGPNGPTNAEASQIPGYSEWIANMDRAFQSPRYDSYALRHAELTHQGWAKSPQVPLSLVSYSLWSYVIPDMSSLRRYVDLRIREAQSAATAGHFEDAENGMRKVALFGQRMIDGSQADFERLDALEIARKTQEALAKLYAQSNRPADAQLAMSQVHALEASKADMLRAWQESRQPIQDYYLNRAALVQGAVWAALVLAALTFLALFLLEIRAIPWQGFTRLRWLACRVADVGPAAVLLLAATFLLSFRPFAHALEQYRTNGSVSADTPDFAWQLFQLSFIRPVRYFFQPSGEAALWLLLTVALSLIVTAIIVRAIWRRAAHAHHA